MVQRGGSESNVVDDVIAAVVRMMSLTSSPPSMTSSSVMIRVMPLMAETMVMVMRIRMVMVTRMSR